MQVEVYVFITSVVDKVEVSASRPCLFTPSGHIECLGRSHSRSGHMGGEKQIFHLPRICPRVFGSPLRRLVTIPTELSRYSHSLIGIQMTSKIVGFCLRYVLIFRTSPPLKSSPTPVRSRAISRRKVPCFVLGIVYRLTGGYDRQMGGSWEVKFLKFSSCLSAIIRSLHYKYVAVDAVWGINRFFLRIFRNTYTVCVCVCVCGLKTS